jgi:predicted polyphosphate/ATP-dependent NAD kinase
VAERLGIDKTLVGVDGFLIDDGGAHLVTRDASEADLRAFVAGGPSSIVLTPIGGQGFLFGRGNQPISAAVIRAVGLDHIVVLATPAKLAELGGQPLLVDTGDPVLDDELSGYLRVITGRGDRAVVRVEQA